ncbi:MAG: aminopeptidase P family protein [Deltaproteobacteria bacterium CG07_land_8_20_14_0_80_38_7]|nr:MAG: aminopeptidase P family protein [Deltaproteobacteria bacterium CG07_land_8_20_14_0_80_38_7]
MNTAKFIYDSPEKNADLYYATGFRAPDPLIYFEHKNKKFLVLSDLEINRAERQAKVNQCLSISKYSKKLKNTKPNPTIIDIIEAIFRERGIKKLIVPKSMPFYVVDHLRSRRFVVNMGTHPFYLERLQKRSDELKHIESAQKIVFQAIKMVEEVLKKSSIKNGRLNYNKQVLTSDRVRDLINVFLMENGCVASDTIVSSGAHSIDPHDAGSGPIKAHESIIVDIFPVSIKTLYCADATRTFCKGRAPDALKKMYHTVKEAQELAISKIHAGVDGSSIHNFIHNYFEKNGFKTGEKNKRMQGFFHSTGHSIGLEIHEEPLRISINKEILKKGYVMSVEPGLYYAGIGGVRIEDLVYVDKNKSKILAGYPKKLEV